MALRPLKRRYCLAITEKCPKIVWPSFLGRQPQVVPLMHETLVGFAQVGSIRPYVDLVRHDITGIAFRQQISSVMQQISSVIEGRSGGGREPYQPRGTNSRAALSI